MEPMTFAFPIANLEALFGESMRETLEEMFGTDATHVSVRISYKEIHAKALTEDEILEAMREDEELEVLNLSDIYSS